MSARGHVNGLAARPHHIKRLCAADLLKRQRRGGRQSGHQRAAQAEAHAVQATLELIQDRRTAQPDKRLPLRVILRAIYRHAYHKGYQNALLKGYRACAPRMTAPDAPREVSRDDHLTGA